MLRRSSHWPTKFSVGSTTTCVGAWSRATRTCCRRTSTTPTCAGKCSCRLPRCWPPDVLQIPGNPIERTAEPAGDGTNLNFTNADNAQEWGFELEARVTGGRIRPSSIRSTWPGTSPTPFRKSKSWHRRPGGVGTITTTRPLQGQSPYVVNAAIGYRKGGTQLSLLYNVIGPRLIEVGTAGAGNVYEQAFHSLDATSESEAATGSRLKISGTNLLNQTIFAAARKQGRQPRRGDLRFPPRRRWSGVSGMVLRRNKQVSKQGDEGNDHEQLEMSLARPHSAPGRSASGYWPWAWR